MEIENAKSLKDVFMEATKMAAEKYGVKRKAKGWQKKFTRIKQEYAMYFWPRYQSLEETKTTRGSTKSLNSLLVCMSSNVQGTSRSRSCFFDR